jgi:hypothetical protein
MSPARFREVRSRPSTEKTQPLILPYPTREFVPEEPAVAEGSRSSGRPHRSSFREPGRKASPRTDVRAPGTAYAGVSFRLGQITFIRTSAPSVNAPGSSGSHTVMIR